MLSPLLSFLVVMLLGINMNLILILMLVYSLLSIMLTGSGAPKVRRSCADNSF